MAIIKYKKGNSWFSIPIYVNTGGEVSDYVTKLELDNKGYISQIKTINGQELVGSGNINIAVDLSNYYTKSDVNGLIPSLDNYYKKSETYSQSEVNALIDSVNAGDVDLSNYYTKSQVDGLIPDDYLTNSSLSGYATQTWVNNKNYAKAADIPTLVSELTNDSGYLTSVPSEYITSSELNSKLSSYAKTNAIPTVASDLVNDMGYLTSIPSNYITETELEAALGGVSGGVISNNEYVTWNVELIDSSARLDITLFSYNATEAINNYSEIVNALAKVGSSIQMTGSGFDATLNVSYIEGTLTFGIIKGRILYGTLTYLLSGKFIAKILTNNNDHIWILVDRNSYLPVDCLNVTYSLLKAFVDKGVLVPGRKYAITDYTCIYRQPVTNIEMEVEKLDENIRIICTATSSNTLSENVEYVRADGYVPIVECKYSIDPESKSWTAGMTSKSPKGVVWYMKDANGNECNYDFKHILFRRWAITDITANLKEHDGTSNGVSPYRVKAKSISKIISDDRLRVGCGEPADEALIRNIVNGTWLSSTNDLKLSDSNGNALSFHSNYSKYYHKPYTDTSKPRLKYLAWNTTMNEDITVSTYHGGLVLYSINSSSYEDMYTFDCNGDDMSELYYNNVPKVLKASIVAGVDIANFLKLPNIVIQTSVDNATISKFEINMGYDNTILLYTYAGLINVRLIKVSLHNFYKNLILTYNWNNTIQERDNMYDNCMVGEVEKCLFTTFYKNAIFGYISNIITTGNFFCNLWFNTGYRVNYHNSNSWTTPVDGTYSLLSTLKGACYSNILGPMLYCTICPHHNTNTYRSYYYKGNFFNANILHNSLGLIKYTKLDYKAIHLAKTGTIDACNINFEAFVGKSNYIKYVNDKLYICGWEDSLRIQLPNMKKLSTSLLSGYYDEWHPYTDFTWNSSYSGNLHSRGILYVDSSKKLLMAAIANII